MRLSKIAVYFQYPEIAPGGAFLRLQAVYLWVRPQEWPRGRQGAFTGVLGGILCGVLVAVAAWGRQSCAWAGWAGG